jgi:transposase-like protein
MSALWRHGALPTNAEAWIQDAQRRLEVPLLPKAVTVTVGTVFEASHAPLSKWWLAIHLLASSKKGVSAHQLHRNLGISYQTAWFMAHRLRYAIATNANTFLKLSDTIEADETYVGARPRIGRTNKEDRAKLATGRHSPKDKKLTPVMALVEPKGRAYIFPVERVNGETSQSEIRKRVHLNSHMITDELDPYHGLDMESSRS